MLDKAIAIAAEAFVNKFDKGGQPYILHCLNVMEQMPKNDIDLRCAAVMHDLIEDTDWSYDGLIQIGFPQEVVITVDMLTHRRNVPYENYIDRIAGDEWATLIKLADLRHNSDITRLKGVRDKDIERMVKYHQSYLLLSDVAKKNGWH